ncbi:uncharacterized protein LOC113501704 [Trichoplusia ni]|uniref:Uncharacterized protein LOC113501704 n=1 Tax=Trichoplusia ni TaxID=7111 RepID=A0A7E5WDB3_TRINI|nr:uncharacterized protein LOC113501704 [Trichoplusia ni]
MDKLMLYYLSRRRRRRIAKKRRQPVSPYVESRLLCGEFVVKFGILRENERFFFKYFKVSLQVYDELYSKLEPYLRTNNLRLKSTSIVSPIERFAMTLRYLVSGHTFVDIHLAYHTGLTTVRKIVTEVCQIIIERLKEECIPKFSRALWEETEKGFLTQAQFPNCIGAIDGKHIRIIRPPHSGSLYYNYKHYYSIVLLAMCNANYEFTYINVGVQGKESDSAIFTQSRLYEQINNDLIYIPPAKALPVIHNDKPTNIAATAALPYIIVGDEAFGLSSHVMRPYARALDLNYKKKIFNYRLTRARRYIECTFGIMANKFRILHRPLNVGKDKAICFLKTICILHNFIRSRSQINDFHDIVIIPDHIRSVRGLIGNTHRDSYTLRDNFADYFVADGQLSWQDRSIY